MSAITNEIQGWIDKADHDLGSAKIIYLHLPDYFDTIAFHCQQAAEKYIKSVLVHKDINFNRSHDLVYLLELLSRHIHIGSDAFDKAITLNGFSVEIRYPNTKIHLTTDELGYSIEVAEYFRDFAYQQVGI